MLKKLIYFDRNLERVIDKITFENVLLLTQR